MYKETVMSDREAAALLRGMPYHPSSEAGWMNFVRRCLLAQAKITWEARQKEVDEAEQRGIKKVVEIVRDWETIPSVEFNKKYKVKLIDDVEEETLLQIIERYLQAFLKEVEKC